MSNAIQTQPTLGEQTVAAMMAELAQLRAQNAELLAKSTKTSDRHSLGNNLSCKVSVGGKIGKDGKVSKGGAVSVYGLHSRFPVTLYKAQWFRLFQVMANLRAFIEANDSQLSVKIEDAE